MRSAYDAKRRIQQRRLKAPITSACSWVPRKFCWSVQARSGVLVALAVSIALTVSAEPSGMRGPGPLASLRPPLGTVATPGYLSILRIPPESGTSAPFLIALNWYRTTLSPLDGPHCQMAPTCSLYAQQAFREYGLMGFVLTADRLFHEADEQGIGNYLERGQRRYLDPLSVNTYWLWDWLK